MDGSEAALRCSLRDCGFPEEAAAQYLAWARQGNTGALLGLLYRQRKAAMEELHGAPAPGGHSGLHDPLPEGAGEEAVKWRRSRWKTELPCPWRALGSFRCRRRPARRPSWRPSRRGTASSTPPAPTRTRRLWGGPSAAAACPGRRFSSPPRPISRRWGTKTPRRPLLPPASAWGLGTWTSTWSTCPSGTTTAPGGPWRSSIRRGRSGPLACATSCPTGCWTCAARPRCAPR